MLESVAMELSETPWLAVLSLARVISGCSSEGNEVAKIETAANPATLITINLNALMLGPDFLGDLIAFSRTSADSSGAFSSAPLSLFCAASNSLFIIYLCRPKAISLKTTLGSNWDDDHSPCLLTASSHTSLLVQQMQAQAFSIPLKEPPIPKTLILCGLVD